MISFLIHRTMKKLEKLALKLMVYLWSGVAFMVGLGMVPIITIFFWEAYKGAIKEGTITVLMFFLGWVIVLSIVSTIGYLIIIILSKIHKKVS